jgi:hypothetical protein
MSEVGFDRLREAIGRARTARPNELSDAGWVADWAARSGLFTDERDLYGPWRPFALPRNTNGTWQHPEEFAGLLVHLSQFAPAGWVEVGCFRGWTTVLAGAYFRRFDKGHHALGLDLPSLWTVPDGLPRPTGVSFGAVGAFDDAAFLASGGPTRVVLIDGDHSYRGVSADWDRFGRVTPFCVFHDVFDARVRDEPGYEGGVWRFWRELKAKHPGRCREFRRPDGVEAFGIGLIDNRGDV